MARALILMLVAMTLIPSGDAAAKLLTSQHDVSSIWAAWIRFVIGAAAILPFTPRAYWRYLGDLRVILRGLLITGGICCILVALTQESMANVFGAFFIGPILSYALSAILLREAISTARSVLLMIGFLGVLLVVKPGFGMTSGLVWAVAAGCFYGCYLTATRWLAGEVPAKALLFAQLFIAMVVTTPFAVFAWPDLSTSIGGLSLISGLCSMLGNLLLLFALRLQPSTRMAPFVYFQLIAATTLGWLIFATFPDTLTLLGLAVLIASGFGSLLLPDRSRG